MSKSKLSTLTFILLIFISFVSLAEQQNYLPPAAAATIKKISNSVAAQYRTTQELTFSCAKQNIGTQGALICAYQIAGMHDMAMTMLSDLKGFEDLDLGCYQNSYHPYSPLQQSIFLGKWLRENPDAIQLRAGSAFLLFWLSNNPIPKKCWKK